MLRLGSGDEQAAAATVFALLCIQLGGGDEAEEGFKMLRPILTSLLIDNSASLTARQSVSNHEYNFGCRMILSLLFIENVNNNLAQLSMYRAIFFGRDTDPYNLHISPYPI